MPEESQKTVVVPSAISTVGLLARALASAASTRPTLAASISTGSATTAVRGPDTGVTRMRREPPGIFTPASTVVPSGTFRGSHPLGCQGWLTLSPSAWAAARSMSTYTRKKLRVFLLAKIFTRSYDRRDEFTGRGRRRLDAADRAWACAGGDRPQSAGADA